MSSRITQAQTSRQMVQSIFDNRSAVDKFGNEVATGIKVNVPGDSPLAGSINDYRESLNKIEGFKSRVASVRGTLTFQDDVLAQVADLMLRAKEVAVQIANEVHGSEARLQAAGEIFQIRDHLVSLANSKYQGRYIYGGADDDDPPFDSTTYTLPATGQASERYIFDSEPGTSTERTVNLTEDLQISVTTPGNTLFENAIFTLERLGRGLAGFETTPVGTGAPDGGGVAYVFPNDFATQTQVIQTSIDSLTTIREQTILPERVIVASKLRRLDTADALLNLNKVNAEEVLTRLQSADITESASNLAQAQTALQASYTVSSRLLNLSILDFL